MSNSDENYELFYIYIFFDILKISESSVGRHKGANIIILQKDSKSF
jgi:hypothetical protein